MMPHSKSDTKLDTKKDIPLINEIAAIRNATKVYDVLVKNITQ